MRTKIKPSEISAYAILMSVLRMAMMFVFVFVSLFEYAKASLQYDQCAGGDVIFTEPTQGMELIHPDPANRWYFEIPSTTVHGCFAGCRQEVECKSAMFFEDDGRCLLQNLDLFGLKPFIKLSTRVRYFEKHECSPTFAQEIKFLQVITDAMDCKDIYQKGWRTNGIYGVKNLKDDGTFKVILCAMDILGGGWSVIQQRIKMDMSFKRKRNVYTDGFGQLNGDFWYGNDKIHGLTRGNQNEVLFILKDDDDELHYPLYDGFNVGTAAENYKLTVGHYRYIGKGKEGLDAFEKHNNIEFSTHDDDNDKDTSINCSRSFGGRGGFWFTDCRSVNINGDNEGEKKGGIKFSGLTTETSNLKETTMLIRRK